MRVHAITIAYTSPPVLKAGLARFYETKGYGLDLTHYLVDGHYPVRPKKVAAAIKNVVELYGMTYLDPGRNLGLHHGLNWACEQIKPSAGDIILVYDADSYPEGFGWAMAIAAGMTVGKFEILGLVDPRSRAEFSERGHGPKHLVDGYLEVWEPVRDGVISVAGYQWDFLSKMGGFDEVLPYYGGLEASMWAKLKAYGGRWGYLPQYGESLHLQSRHDPELNAYKQAHAQDRTFVGSFEEYLAAGLFKASSKPR